MARGLLAGMTDYSHQTFQDILDDLDNWKTCLLETTDFIETAVMQLEDMGYWSQVSYNMKTLVAYALRFFHTSYAEIDDISQKLEIEVQKNHIVRLDSLADTAHELSMDFGKVWHQHFGIKDYGNPNFSKVEKIYSEGRGMAFDMLDLSNVAARLETFIGMKSGKVDQVKPNKHTIPILLFILGILIGIVTNVASGIWPPTWQPYLWLSWPLVGLLTAAGIFLLIKE